jgi:hypothetical protein
MDAPGTVPALRDARLHDLDDVAVGTVETLLYDADTNRPQWLIVCLPDGRRTVVPTRGTRPTVAGMRSAHGAGRIAACPTTITDPVVTPEALALAGRHYAA